ncbi:MAG: dTDP-4-dehydrorhamnose 3,5-epimerase [Gammaproteobacteria bacterium]|nr:dTDP-4-dehydrorhamnose 3,5-epimerase [Gammaproteobacteria bacterium]
MKFTATPISDAVIIDLTPLQDERGFFARSWCYDEFKANGLDPRIAQCNISYNTKQGTLRGLHYQASPYEEVKLVRCTQGAIYDVIADLRPSSPSFKRWFALELTAANRRMLYVPQGVAHGFITLTNDTEVCYQMSQVYSPDHARGVRWNDPAFGIVWPVAVVHISERDRSYVDFS